MTKKKTSSRITLDGELKTMNDEEEEIILPRPVNGPVYDEWTLEKWLLKVCEECGEAITAYKHLEKTVKDYQQTANSVTPDMMTDRQAFEKRTNLDLVRSARHALCRELTDTITAATSALHYLGAHLEERQSLQREVNESNAKRDGGKRFREA